jgi:hypothetical protein
MKKLILLSFSLPAGTTSYPIKVEFAILKPISVGIFYQPSNLLRREKLIGFSRLVGGLPVKIFDNQYEGGIILEKCSPAKSAAAYRQKTSRGNLGAGS